MHQGENKGRYLPAVDLLEDELLVGQLVDRRPPFVLRLHVGVTNEVVVTRLPARPGKQECFILKNTANFRSRALLKELFKIQSELIKSVSPKAAQQGIFLYQFSPFHRDAPP